MKLTVENFGPIRKANVDIRPMTVFVGHSNTGKSYLAILIYITKKVLSIPTRFFRFLGTESSLSKRDEIDENRYEELVRELLGRCVDVVHEQWKNEAIRCFGEEWENLIGQDGKSALIQVSSSGEKITLDLIAPENDKLPRIGHIVEKIKKQVSSVSARRKKNSRSAAMVDFRRSDLGKIIYSEIKDLFDFLPEISRYQTPDSSSRRRYSTSGYGFLDEGGDTHYLPAVRGGLMQSHRILVSALVDRAPTIGLTGAEIIPFTGVLADFLQKLLNIGDRRLDERRKKGIATLSEKIEQGVMRGSIQMKKLATRYPDFRYQFADTSAGSRDISLMNASSSVSELAPIVLFIRHYLSPGDLFIVEEPEAHLHPEAQRIVAGVLVELVKAGVYVVVTTHSDIILEQISNFVYANEVSEAKVLGKTTAENCTLSKREIGAYVFRRNNTGKGTDVRKTVFDEETGILTKDHLDVSSDLYNETVELFNMRERTNDA